MKTYFVITGIVKNKDKVLILRKSPTDRNYPNRWSFCSGYIKEFESAESSVLREIKEETGLDAKIIKKGKLFQKNDKRNGKSWVIMPFLCEVKSSDIKLDHENIGFRWINCKGLFKEIKKYPRVPGFEKDLKALDLL